MTKSKKITNVLLLVSLFVLLFGAGYKWGEYRTSIGKVDKVGYSILNTTANNNKNIDFTLFWDAWDKIEKNYVDKKKIDPKKMYYGAIKGMVASVDDPYTFFLTPDENKQAKDDLGGKFEGIGAQLGMKLGRVIVIAPIKGSPSEKAGVRAGDYVVRVNNEAIKGMILTQVVDKIRGEKGTKVSMTFERDGKEYTVDLIRDTINVSSVDVKVDEKVSTCVTNCPTVAYLKLSQFGDNTADEWDKAIIDIKDKWNAKQISGLVLDLRDNPGGYLESSVYIAGEFLKESQLVVKQESTTIENKNYYVTREGKLLDIPLTILINGGSASAAEILSGALRDHKRAELIGEKSFGKGSVQEALDLNAGAGLHVTVAKWVLPNGDWINGKGIEPQIKVTNTVAPGDTLTRDTDAQLDKAIEEVLLKK